MYLQVTGSATIWHSWPSSSTTCYTNEVYKVSLQIVALSPIINIMSGSKILLKERLPSTNTINANQNLPNFLSTYVKIHVQRWLSENVTASVGWVRKYYWLRNHECLFGLLMVHGRWMSRDLPVVGPWLELTMTETAELTRLTLENIALDLQITICIFLRPIDILALRKVCHQSIHTTRSFGCSSRWWTYHKDL